jgi:hypothetical protein
MQRILLVEPAYKSKYPPLGLMKISTYHKLRGDYVRFTKGCDSLMRDEKWDRIYVSTLFTFYWDVTVKTIQFYRRSVRLPSDIFVGGVMATLLGTGLSEETGATIIKGLIDQPGVLDPGDRHRVDELIPDYQILDEVEHNYLLNDSYIAYATRGCPNRCSFCAVHTIEPTFAPYIPLKKQIMGVEEIYGPKQHLILLDNNVLASDRFERIINDILELGFHKGAKMANKGRRVDFNQGTDANYLTSDKMALLARIPIKPLRIAFDHIALRDIYVSKIKLARDNGILNLSNYVLYNHTDDTPEDFYERLRINCQLNLDIGTKIYSFPMKYIPLDAKNRSFVGTHWNRKLLRGVQCILLATRGLVTTRLEFFEAAFGRSAEEFRMIAMMPEHYIIQRRKYENNGAGEWQAAYNALAPGEKSIIANIAGDRTRILETMKTSRSLKIKNLLGHYLDENGRTIKG